MTVAVPFAFRQAEGMTVILAAEYGCKIGDTDTLGFLCVTLGFLDFSDEAGVH